MSANRKFGEIPQWAKEGPTNLRNYGFRAEEFCAKEGASRGHIHPTIELDSPDFAMWFQYFDRHLGGLPWAMKALCDKVIVSMTVPAQFPQWFDKTFEPDPNYVVVLPSQRSGEISETRYRANRANVFVPEKNAFYARMVDLARSAGPHDYYYDNERNGIWVPRGWVEDLGPRDAPRRLDAKTLGQMAAKYDTDRAMPDGRPVPPGPIPFDGEVAA